MEKNRYLVVGLFVVIAIVVIQLAVGFAVYNFLPDWPTRGQFGDVFGVVNALFSGLAFAGLIYAILLQREDLSLQRKELELTRQELQRSAGAQEQSEIALRAQAESASQSARLATINFLLDHYKAELERTQGFVFVANDPRRGRLMELRRRKEVLIVTLDSLFKEVIETGEPNDAV